MSNSARFQLSFAPIEKDPCAICAQDAYSSQVDGRHAATNEERETMSATIKSQSLTDRLNRELSARGDMGPSHREMVAGDEYGRSLTIRPSGSAWAPWTLTIRPTMGAARVSQHASVEDAQRAADEHLGRSRLLTGWTWIEVARPRAS